MSVVNDEKLVNARSFIRSVDENFDEEHSNFGRGPLFEAAATMLVEATPKTWPKALVIDLYRAYLVARR